MTHYVIIRSDLPIGFLAAQVVHAAGESSPGSLPPNTNAVVLTVPNEDSLREIGKRLVMAGVPHIACNEPDAPWCGQLTAIGIVPLRDRKLVKPIVGRLKLLSEETIGVAV